MSDFKLSDKVDGFYRILDTSGKYVGVRNQSGVLKPKRFKTKKSAIDFIKYLEYAVKQEETQS